jgi:hypothetical protein
MNGYMSQTPGTSEEIPWWVTNERADKNEGRMATQGLDDEAG